MNSREFPGACVCDLETTLGGTGFERLLVKYWLQSLYDYAGGDDAVMMIMVDDVDNGDDGVIS